jgi:hypothetical protein
MYLPDLPVRLAAGATPMKKRQPFFRTGVVLAVLCVFFVWMTHRCQALPPGY